LLSDPPAGKATAVGVQGAGQGDEVAEDPFEGAAAWVAAQEVGADAGEAVEDVVLGERGQVAAEHAGKGGVGAAVGECGDVGVQGRPRFAVAGVESGGGGVQEERNGGCAEEQAGGVGGADVAGGRLSDPAVCQAPGAEACVGPFHMQQGNAGRPLCEGLRQPRLVRGRWSGLSQVFSELPRQVRRVSGRRSHVPALAV
jgi:hypothetical protein